MSFLRNYKESAIGTAAPFYRNYKVWPVTASGYEKLSNSITANSTTVATPTFRFHGSAAAATWVPEVGATNVVEANSGVTTAITYGASGAWGTGPDYNGGIYHEAGADAYGIDTGDFILEFVYKHISTASLGVVGKYSTGAATGWYVYTNTTGRQAIYLRNGGTSVNALTASSTFTDGNTYHCMWFCDRSDATTSGLRLYVNGSLAFSGSASTLSASSLDHTTSRLRVGTNAEAPTNEFTNPIYYAALWKSAAWFAGGATNDSEWAAIAAARYASVGVAL